MNNLKPFIILQKKALRIIHNAHQQEHTNTPFIDSGQLIVQDVIKLKTLRCVQSKKTED